jgi:hypothetical protein
MQQLSAARVAVGLWWQAVPDVLGQLQHLVPSYLGDSVLQPVSKLRCKAYNCDWLMCDQQPLAYAASAAAHVDRLAQACSWVKAPA